jgi:preprotein translocase subunit Sec63
MTVNINNAYEILGSHPGASLDDFRKAYLSLVRQYPPDREPEKFREVHAAYQLVIDPMEQAKSLLIKSRDQPDLVQVIAAAEKIRPRLATLNLLALGNEE